MDRFSLAGEPLEDRRLLAIDLLNVPNFDYVPGVPLEIELGGYTAGPGDPNPDDGYDQINVAGQANLGGTLQVTLINDFVPVDGDMFKFLTFGEVTGSFAEVTGPYDFGDNNRYFEVDRLADRLQLVVR